MGIPKVFLLFYNRTISVWIKNERQIMNWIDYLIFGLYMACVLSGGIYYFNKNKSTEDYYVGSRSIKGGKFLLARNWHQLLFFKPIPSVWTPSNSPYWLSQL